MIRILHIETATSVCSVAISADGVVIASENTKEANSHSSKLTVMIENLINRQKLSFLDLSAVSVSKGPGSYTGLRIGVSVAKGLCYGLDIPLISVDTLQAMAFGIKQTGLYSDCFYCPMIDARRMEVYTALFDEQLNVLKEVAAKIIDAESYQDILQNKKIVFFGDGAAKVSNVIRSPNAVFDTEFAVSAAHQASIAYNRFVGAAFENVAYFEPFYLKDFIAGKPKVKGLL